MSFCPKCGGEMGEGAQFCPKCGMTVSAQSQEASQTIVQQPSESQQPPHQMQPGVAPPQGPPPPQQPYGAPPQQPYGAPQQPYGPQGAVPMMPPGGAVGMPQKSNNTLKIVLIALGAFVLVGIAAIVLFFVLMFNSGPANVSKEFLTAINKGDTMEAWDLTSEVFRANATQRDLKDFVDIFRGELEKWSVTSVKIDSNNVAETLVTADLNDGSKMKFEFELMKEGGDWKVNYIEPIY